MREVLEVLGYNPHNHRSQGISADLLDWAEEIVCMGNVHEKFIITCYPQHCHKVTNWLIDDPHFAVGSEKHHTVANQIKELVLNRFC